MQVIFKAIALQLGGAEHGVEVPERVSNLQVDVVPATRFADPIGVVSFYRWDEEEWKKMEQAQAKAELAARFGVVSGGNPR